MKLTHDPDYKAGYEDGWHREPRSRTMDYYAALCGEAMGRYNAGYEHGRADYIIEHL